MGSLTRTSGVTVVSADGVDALVTTTDDVDSPELSAVVDALVTTTDDVD